MNDKHQASSKNDKEKIETVLVIINDLLTVAKQRAVRDLNYESDLGLIRKILKSQKSFRAMVNDLLPYCFDSLCGHSG